ncbi:MAG: hypothetical protein HC799_19735, partial [Limnothrix sp. RL_2_0]|nr:hypothetical protein [Limnothrix sp. RL_2_0]
FNVSLSSIDQEAHSNKNSSKNSKNHADKKWDQKGEATLILLTHLVQEDVFKEALAEIEKLKCIKDICCTLRVFE